MKSKILIAIIVLLATQAYSQPSLGIQYTTKGGSLDGGYKINNTQISVGYNIPLSTKNSTPNYTYVNIGQSFILTNNELWNTSITPMIGMAHYHFMNVKGEIKNGFKPIYGIEIGRDCELGRFFISGGYCTIAWAGIGMRFYVN
jgi:hypothetical protein